MPSSLHHFCTHVRTGLCLKRVRDTLGMGAELYRALMMYYVCGSCYFTLIALMDYSIVRFSSRIHFMLVAGLAFMLLDTNLYSRRSWSTAVTELSFMTVGTTVGTPVGGSDNSFVSSSERPYSSALGLRSERLYSTSASNSRRSSIAGGLSQQRAHPHDRLLLDRPEDMINDSFLHGAFQEHVEKSLCYEHYKFLAEAMAYSSATYRNPKQQVRHC
jgi:hypothetical protein